MAPLGDFRPILPSFPGSFPFVFVVFFWCFGQLDSRAALLPIIQVFPSKEETKSVTGSQQQHCRQSVSLLSVLIPAGRFQRERYPIKGSQRDDYPVATNPNEENTIANQVPLLP